MNNPNTSPVETHEEIDTSVVEEVGTDIQQYGEAAEDVAKALVTLESIAVAIEAAPRLSALEAKVANAVIERINTQFDLPARAVGLEAETDARKAALEDLSSKIETFKKTFMAIIAKIVEMAKKFWEWLTLNSKKLKTNLTKLKGDLKNHSGSVEVPTSGSLKALTSDTALTHDSINDVAAELHALIPAVTNFCHETSPDRFEVIISGKGFTALKSADAQLKDYPERDNVRVLYKNIGGRSLHVAFDPELIVSAIAANDRASVPYQVKLTPAESQTELPQAITLDEKQVLNLVLGADAVVDMVEKHFHKINDEIKNLKQSERWSDKRDTEKLAMLRSYSQAFGVFVDGVFTQGLRYASAVGNLTHAYMKVNPSNVIDNPA